jgi:predicted nucleotidyltransferase component of viral defense system
MDFVREFGLAAQVVEKDYVLGWVLAGIFNHPVIGSSWVFKGGTCLKKCFFETYRFSEDLDFTLSEANHLDQVFLVSCFKEIAQWVYNEAGIEIPQNLIRFDVYQNKYRLIEPYSLRRTREGNILLYALRHETNEWRAYRVDRIQDAEITQTSFVPKHAVELTPARPISIPQLTRRSSGHDVFGTVKT